MKFDKEYLAGMHIKSLRDLMLELCKAASFSVSRIASTLGVSAHRNTKFAG